MNELNTSKTIEVMCKNCSQIFTPYQNDAWGEFCSEICYQKLYHKKLRLKVLKHYGGDPPKCECCGENHIEFLCFDHIKGKGNQHRKENKIGSIYYWLKARNYPEGFRVLCHNCNMSIGFYGYCPHKKEN